MTSTTDPAQPAARAAHRIGAVLVAAAFAALTQPGLVAAALALEALALAFWLWARAAPDAPAVLARWAWVRRPALALWLAVGLAAVLPPFATVGAGADSPPTLGPATPYASADPLAVVRAMGALAVLWAALELLAAAPLSRPFPDLPGPLPGRGGWVSVLLPLAGFLLAWGHRDHWLAAPLLAELASVLLLAAAALAALRAHARRGMAAAWRWLVVCDSALAGLALAQRAVPAEPLLGLWLAAAGGRTLALVAEAHGGVSRRGDALARAWRLAGAVASGCLAWPLLAELSVAASGLRPVETVLVSAPVALGMWVGVHRIVALPERRAAPREGGWTGLAWALAGIVLLAGPLVLVAAWWRGQEVSLPGGLVAMLALAVPLLLRPRADAAADRLGRGRATAASIFRGLVASERRLVAALAASLRMLVSPLRDLHTGHAQEYLLFLVGVAVLALLLPLLR